MTIYEMRQIINEIEFEDYSFDIVEDGDKAFLQASYYEADIITGEPELQKTRKWYLSPHQVKSELVQTAFKCVMTSMEHRTREHFLYRGKRVFGPHFDVDALWQICKDGRLDYRGRRDAKAVAAPAYSEDLVEVILEGLETNSAALLPLSKHYEAELWNSAMDEALRRRRK